MKSLFDQKQIQALKKSDQYWQQTEKTNFHSRHKIEQTHFYLKEDWPSSLVLASFKSRRKK